MSSRFLKQSSVLTLGAFVFFFLFYGLPVMSVVIKTYYLGGTAFLQGTDPYAATISRGAGNQFKYSPLFALFAGEMAKTQAQPFAIGLWIGLSMAIFFAGISRWVDLLGTVKAWMTFAIVLCVLELALSLILGQANALIIGLLLLGLAEYRDQRFFSAGAMIMLATNLKVYPVIFLVGLAFRRNKSYWLGALVMGMIAFLLPICAVGWSHNLQTHLSWIRVVSGDAGGAGTLDIYSTLERFGLATLGKVMKSGILIATIPIFFGYIAIIKNLNWRAWSTFGVAALLLLSPRTELFTYVLLAPSYLLMVDLCLESQNHSLKKYGSIVFVGLATLITSCQFTSSRWLDSFAPIEICRVLGALGFWIISGCILFRDFSAQGSQAKTPRESIA